MSLGLKRNGGTVCFFFVRLGLDRRQDPWDPIFFGGSKVLQMYWERLEGFSTIFVHEVWVSVVFHDHPLEKFGVDFWRVALKISPASIHQT